MVKKPVQKGFSLIELLIVIAIIGILTLIAVSAYISAQKKSRDVTRKGDIAATEKALEGYYNDVGTYPPENSGLIQACGLGADDCPWGSAFAQAIPDGDDDLTIYMGALPRDPLRQNYSYVYENTGAGYRLYARLENTNDPDIPVVGASSGAYDMDCSAIVGTNINCNYVKTSENIPDPTPIVVP